MSAILPKNERENLNFCPSLLEQKFFVRFLEELKTPKCPFEIIWPLSTQRKLGSFDKMTLVFCQMFLYFYLYLFYCYTITYFLLTYTLIVHSYSPATNQQICSQILKENILIWKDQFRKVHITDLFQMRIIRLRCLLHVKGLVICFHLGWSGSTLLITKHII